jgi:hypothetical protein
MLTTIETSLLRCPATGAPLDEHDGKLWAGDRGYPIVSGVPVLIDADLSVFAVEAPVDQRISPVRRIIRKLIPEKNPGIGTSDRYARFIIEMEALTDHPRALIIGGGTLGRSAEVLVKAPRVTTIETDVYIGPRTQVVCDGHNLPFADGTFDGVVTQAVLEHVLDPVRVVAEIHRVLKPGGIVFAQTPFMQQVHEGPYDFTRWTETGHRRLFRMFASIDTGVTAGPAISLLWAIIYFVRAFPRKRSTQLVAEKLAILMFAWWLKPLDRFVISKPGGTDGACGVYFIGSRAETPVDDAEVIGAYRGALGRPKRK